MFIVSLYKIANNELIWGRPTAKKYREIILEQWDEDKEETLVLDFSSIALVDYSAACELIGVPISRLQSELKDKHVIIRNATSEVAENINVALHRQELCCMNILDENKYELLGKWSAGLKDIIDSLYVKRKADSRALAEELKTTIQVINNRTTTLYKLGLIKRESYDAPTGGKQYIYESII